MRNFTMEDNCVCIGYAHMAMEIYNRRIEKAKKEHDYQDEYYNMRMLSEEEMRKILSCLHSAFDRCTEEEALNYGR